MGKYVGSVVEIIYLDRNNQITQRRVRVRSIKGNILQAYCFLAKSPRVFKLENILAINAVNRHVV
ncbi:hypothetical protein ERIC1_1c34090 [Paenibacillus larvae subsp. larvae DSM 25719]|uniref:Putative DNA binding transcriptional regulator n=1 Tax=Paenibacillus phage BN12 TaxID=2070189 RepID=A0A2I7SCF7_9CAUD|nr:putative DNA binding transcriptional regulator [Paenibacillus phage BN12]AUS03584.1 putative DNA binding transcriptional regulator [Paenibacillus phage BN12]ETK29850.1 hypothetical protein ERIC1_1c34090 [Paenibacillus larvae subsp. larvae DSM 25719]